MGRINVTRSSMPPLEEYVDEIRPLWETRWLTNRGAIFLEFEKALCAYLDVTNVSLFANGHNGLEVPIGAFALTGEVITTPYTFCSTTHSLVRNGLIPVFCDINERDFTIDADQIERHITEKTSAILGVHVYGRVCDFEKIRRIADKYSLHVLYDAAHAFGVTVNGVGVGSFGDMSMFSCHATKVFHSIEGGITVLNDAKIREKVKQITNFGFVNEDEIEFVGTNARMNEFAAAMGLCNLRHIDEYILRRGSIDARYRERLNGVKGIRLLGEQTGVTCNYAYFPVLFDGYKENRDQIQAKLAAEGIGARKYFYPLVSQYACYREQYGAGIKDTPLAKHAADCVLTLPMYEELSLEDVDRICDIILR